MKKKILLLSDDLRMTSGVAVMSKEIVLGTVDKYDWVQLGAAIKHPDYGKVIDVSQDVQKISGVKNASVKIYPYNGYGDANIIKQLLDIEKPDAILHFTDPKYWIWLYDIEHEIRQTTPIFFYHVWDNLPDPKYNRNYYESCDWIGCISKQTYGLVSRIGKDNSSNTFKQLEDWQVSYVPHGINSGVFKPVSTVNSGIKKGILGDKKYDFILYYNNRNITRKQPSDVILSYKTFCDMLPETKSDKCLLLMHTDPMDSNGTNLGAVADVLCPDYDIKFSVDRLQQQDMNEIYNLVDCTINIANNEGFGLTTAESLMAGTPIIVNVTGGLQDQCGFNYTADEYIEIGSLHRTKVDLETEWAIPVWSAAFNVKGSLETPYLYEDNVNYKDVADAIYKMYSKTKKERKQLGKEARKYMLDNFSSEKMCEELSKGMDTAFDNFKKKNKFEVYKIV